MKRRFSKILGVGLVLALLASFLMAVVPVSAVTTPVVTLTAGDADPVTQSAGVISKLNVYKVLFTVGSEIPVGGQIVVGFPAGTNISAITTGDVQIQNTPGIGETKTYIGTENPVVSKTGTYPAAQTLTIKLDGAKAIGAGAIVQLTIGKINTPGCVTNPGIAGSYNLTVATKDAAAKVIEAAVTSAAYTIKVPTIAGLPGVASVYNPTGVLMAQKNILQDAINAAGVDYTIQVGPGTYALTTATLTIAHEGLTFVSTDGAATTIIDASGAGTPAIHIQADDVTFEGFTLDGSPDDGIWIKQGTDGVIVQNNIFVDGGSAIVLEGENNGVVVTGAIIADNVIEDCVTAIVMLGGATDCTISGNTITGCTDTATAITIAGGSASLATEGNTITGNTITDNAGSGIYLFNWSGGGGGYLVDNVIEGNTISGNEGNGIVIASSATNVAGLEILGNDITDNEEDGILIAVTGAWDPSNAIKFNTITGNNTSTGDYGIESAANNDVNDVDATLNWWGTAVATDIAKMVKGTATSKVVYDPFLAGTADAVFSATKVGTGAALNASTTVGVNVSVTPDANVISVAKYIANPQAAISGTIAFYDVYVAKVGGYTTPATDKATIKFYAGDANTKVYLWSAATDMWAPVTPVSFSTYGGYVYVTVDPAMLAGTPFALVAGEAEEDVLDAPTIDAPKSGADTVSLMPTFAWTPGEDANADGYYFELADNANFVLPLVRLDGDVGRLIVTAYAYVGELPYSTAYYWRVKAVSGTVEAGDLLESDWVSAVFITKAEPVEPIPPVTVQEAPVLPPITITQPDIIITSPDVIVPAATPITPSWIYAIIAVGAVLVIGLLVLIIRTRRVA